MNRSAVISECGLYRYQLARSWGGEGVVLNHQDRSDRCVVFIGLNPSTADGTQDDPTLHRCINFAKAWEYDGLVMLNLFAFRATDPKTLLTAPDPIGPENDDWLRRETAGREVVVCWGAVAERFRQRWTAVLALLPARPKCLGKTSGGMPRHPLYVKGPTKLVSL